ncbi:lysoplasmalogenase family protein [Rhodococcus gannanensis]|uniref:Lysoplasmalogenase family protein n=1 Tax=Rhodococcus gannanensis TaxID=1960308 RepID=A0ABW4P6Y9_9NOCA
MKLDVPPRGAVLVIAVFALLVVVHLAAQLADADRLVDVTQWFLMPVLAAILVAVTSSPHSRLVRTALVALAFSWLGDTAPDAFDGDTAFLVMIGFFLLAQLAYVAAFLPYRDRSVLRRPAVAGYVLAVALLVAACAPGAGALLVPALVYGLCLGTMAVLSTGLGVIAGVGGALFLASDAMIALGAFADWFTPPVEGFWVMLTYIAGQALLAYGVAATDRAATATPDVSSVAR